MDGLDLVSVVCDVMHHLKKQADMQQVGFDLRR